MNSCFKIFMMSTEASISSPSWALGTSPSLLRSSNSACNQYPDPKTYPTTSGRRVACNSRTVSRWY